MEMNALAAVEGDAEYDDAGYNPTVPVAVVPSSNIYRTSGDILADSLSDRIAAESLQASPPAGAYVDVRELSILRGSWESTSPFAGAAQAAAAHSWSNRASPAITPSKRSSVGLDDMDDADEPTSPIQYYDAASSPLGPPPVGLSQVYAVPARDVR